MIRSVNHLNRFRIVAADGSVLVAPEWIEDISWEQERVKVDVSREQPKNAPPASSAG